MERTQLFFLNACSASEQLISIHKVAGRRGAFRSIEHVTSVLLLSHDDSGAASQSLESNCDCIPASLRKLRYNPAPKVCMPTKTPLIGALRSFFRDAQIAKAHAVSIDALREARAIHAERARSSDVGDDPRANRHARNPGLLLGRVDHRRRCYRPGVRSSEQRRSSNRRRHCTIAARDCLSRFRMKREGDAITPTQESLLRSLVLLLQDGAIYEVRRLRTCASRWRAVLRRAHVGRLSGIHGGRAVRGQRRGKRPGQAAGLRLELSYAAVCAASYHAFSCCDVLPPDL